MQKENPRSRVAFEENARWPSVMWLAQQTHGLGSDIILRNLDLFFNKKGAKN